MCSCWQVLCFLLTGFRKCTVLSCWQIVTDFNFLQLRCLRDIQRHIFIARRQRTLNYIMCRVHTEILKCWTDLDPFLEYIEGYLISQGYYNSIYKQWYSILKYVYKSKVFMIVFINTRNFIIKCSGSLCFADDMTWQLMWIVSWWIVSAIIAHSQKLI